MIKDDECRGLTVLSYIRKTFQVLESIRGGRRNAVNYSQLRL